MRDEKPSRTAEYMAFFRALETEEPPAHRLFTDAFASALLSPRLRAVIRVASNPLGRRVVRTLLNVGWPHTRSSGVVRTRSIDDQVRQAIEEGARQLVLLGAGFDSRAYRLTEANRTKVFEVDHPATQSLKRERLAQVNGMPSTQVRFVAVDFEKDHLAQALNRAGFNPDVRSVVVWEGVISYLTEEAVENNLALLARMLAPRSSLIFTYMHRGILDGSTQFHGTRRWKGWVGASGEPFKFGFFPELLPDVLRRFGFRLVSDASTHEIAQQYCAALGRRESGSQAYRVALAAREE